MFRVRGAYHLSAAILSGADWSAAAGPEPEIREDEPPPARPERVIGVVEQFDRERATGWVTVRPGHPPVTITLLVGKLRALTTTAHATADAPRRVGAGEIRHFTLPLSDVWQFVGPATRLWVLADGRTLPVAGHGMYRRGGRDGTEQPRDLAAALQAGGSFDQHGRFRPASPPS